MSYTFMDHAAWVQRNIEAGKTLATTARDRRRAAEHRGWLAAPEKLSPFHARAFDILGMVGNGIYNAPISWDTVYWRPDGKLIAVLWRHSLSTFDFSALTRLVFLCHEGRIRGDITPKMHHLEITLSERCAEGGMSSRHPNLEEAVAAFRGEMGEQHHIRYQPPVATAA